MKIWCSNPSAMTTVVVAVEEHDHRLHRRHTGRMRPAIAPGSKTSPVALVDSIYGVSTEDRAMRARGVLPMAGDMLGAMLIATPVSGEHGRGDFLPAWPLDAYLPRNAHTAAQ